MEPLVIPGRCRHDPPATPSRRPRKELLWLLVQASELEHGLMCEYLFAQFTLKCSTDEVLSRYFVHSGETADQITVLARTAKHLMNG